MGQQLSTDRSSSNSFSSSGEEDGKATGGRGSFPSSSSSSAAAPVATTTAAMQNKDSATSADEQQQADRPSGVGSGLMSAFARTASGSSMMAKLFSAKRPSLPDMPPAVTTDTDVDNNARAMPSPAPKDDSPRLHEINDDPFAEEHFVSSPHSSASSSSRTSSVVMSPRTFEALDAEFKPPTLSRFFSATGNQLTRTDSKARIARLQSKHISDSDSDSSLDSDSSSDDEILQDDEIEVNDWLDEPEDAVFSPKQSNTRHSSFSSSSSTLHGAHSSNSLTGGPTTGRSSVSSSSNSITALATWLSSPDDQDDEMEEDDEPVLTPFMQENMPVYEVMKQVQLFRNLSQNQQEQVVRALKPTKFQDGEVIVQQGMRGSRFYMIAKGNAVVTKTTKNSNGQEQERMITHLHAGHYFGELALIYDDPRTATVRAIGDVELLYLTQEDFQRIGQVHLSLMLQQVPLLARLSARDQDIVLSRLKPANFNDGEYIVCQGEEGTRFYMITRGEAVVSERATTTTTNADGSTSTKNYEKELTRLYEGHVFGEMSLIYSEPRTASVRAVGPVKCLYLSKEDFDKCLLSDPFQRFIQESYVEKATRRAMRLRLQQRTSTTGKDGGATPATPGGGVAGGFGGAVNSNPNTPTAIPPPAPTSPAKATETRKLVKQRLKNGQKVVNKYMIKGDLGKGTFGRVKLCQNEEDGKLYAVKIMHKTFVQRMAGKEDQLQDVLRREVAIMKKLNHRNVVKLVEVIDDPSSEKMYLVQEYVQHNLMDEVTRANGLNEEVARKYMRDLLSGLHYLHFHKVIHRDIKPENILVSAEGVAKIADFGTARMIMNESETLSGAKGTPAFMAPEMFNIDATYTGPSVDIWSLGATLYMMVIGRPPWLADNEIILAERVQRDELKFPKESERTMEPHLKNLIQRMLTKDPSLRLTLIDCFNHDWITKEGSEPLGMAAQENDLTVSFDESERAIQNIPERIDLSLSESLARAHLLVKTRQQVGGGVVRTSSGHSLGMGTPVSGQLENRIPTAASISSTSSSTSPSRSSTEEVSRVINAWRHHKRVHLMDGHKELSARSKELLLEQKRMAFSVDRAKVTEIILPAAGPTARSRYPSSSSVNPNLSTTSSNNSSDGSLPGSPRHQSSPNVFTSRNNSVESNPLLKKRSSSRMIDTDHGNLEGFGRTSFTSVTRLSDGLFTTNAGGADDSGDRDSLSSSSDGGGEARGVTTDLDLMKRSLSRKKDFLMVTSEVFRNEDGDYQSRKILFQAKDEDFSVASRVPTHSKSGRELGRASSSQTKSSSRKSIGSSPFNNSGGSLASNSSNGSGSKRSGHRRSSSSVDEFNMDDLDCVQVTEVDDEDEDDDDDEKSRARGFSKASAHSQRHDEVHSSSSDSDDESVYSDVEGDVDVDATFNDLIGTPNNINLCADDEEIAPLDPPSRGSSTSNLLDFQKQSIVQVYVSSKIRENLKLGIRSGYAEAKMSRSYMEDKSTGIAECNLTKFDPSVVDAFESLAFFGVYDGHNGDDTAVWLQRELHNRFFMHPQFVNEPMEAIATVCDAIDHEILNAQNRSMLPKRKRATTNGDYDEDDDEDEEVEEICDENDMTCHLQPISFSGAVSVFAVLAKRKKRRVEEEETTVEENSAVEGGGDAEEKTVDESIEPKEAEEDNGDIAAADAADEAEQEEELEPVDQPPINAGLKIIIPTDDITAEDVDITESKPDGEPQTTLYIANVGDCRAVLCTADGLAVELTKDHKAALPEEKARIEASGGFVHNGRLDGILAISRGFGDLAHKQDGHLIATPDIYERAIGPDDEFLLLASDGLFDVLSSQQSVNFIRRKLLTHGDVQLAAQEMLLKAQQYFAHDNISVIIVALNQEASELT